MDSAKQIASVFPFCFLWEKLLSHRLQILGINLRFLWNTRQRAVDDHTQSRDVHE